MSSSQSALFIGVVVPDAYWSSGSSRPRVPLTTGTPLDQCRLEVGRYRGHRRLKRAASIQTRTSNVAHVGPRGPSTNREESR